MQIVIAADAFKGSNTSLEAGEAIQRGFAKVFPQAGFQVVRVADGGEGTVDAVLQAAGGSLQRLEVCGPLGLPVPAFWGLLAGGGRAVIEMAAASGLPLLRPEQYDPLRTTTYGTGQLLRAALDAGAKQIMLGIGGSATNDGGAGMAQALGARFLDKRGREIERGGGGLEALANIDVSGIEPRLRDAEIQVACDVRNPLLGQFGASAVFGPQKGADVQTVRRLDANLAHLAEVVRRELGGNLENEAGAGAAGGLGFGLLAFCGGKLLSGIETLLRIIEFDKILAGADLVLTGEGRLDGQSIYGKVPLGIAKWAKQAGKPVVAIAGELGAEAHAVFEQGIDALFPTVERAMSAETAMSESCAALEACAERAARALLLGMRLKRAQV